eukprot:CAMPEP_0115440160 /NCGR_PEP_ID=MMETSP0271-20121206/36151_1 /TAXON_ID=71861 /ORGANISM="Scrippsiella trochoidea, Strain CCMP3099" /LENGTH=58 /DNA_ID=CAMNT_0002865879 /DNA_START=142 /DNA_END=316 /DNA_ORIENTATION=+
MTRIEVLLVEVFVDRTVNVPTKVPNLIGAPDHEAAGIEGLRPIRDHKVLDQARIVERL